MHMRWQVVAVSTMVLSACSDNHVIDPGPGTGGVAITFMTTGDSPDPDGYTFSVDGGTEVAIAINGSATQGGLAAGDHLVAVSGLANHCTVAGENPRTVTVIAGDTTAAAFEVTCLAPPCGIQSTTSDVAYQDQWPVMNASRLKLTAGCARRSPASVGL